MKTLKPIHRLVALDLALGKSLAEICDVRELKLPSWRQITQGTLFKEEVRKFMVEIENERIAQFVTDPVQRIINDGAQDAAKTLVREMHSDADDANANSRTRAAKEILTMAGYGQEKEKQGSQIIQINVSQGKLDSIMERGTRESKVQVGESLEIS